MEIHKDIDDVVLNLFLLMRSDLLTAYGRCMEKYQQELTPGLQSMRWTLLRRLYPHTSTQTLTKLE